MSSPSCLPLSCLSWLIKRVIKGDCDWVEVVKSEAKEIMSITGKRVFKLQWKVRIRCSKRKQQGRRQKGRGWYKHEVGSNRGRKRERGKEKTRLPQHDLQNALSPWRLLSALSLRSNVVVQPAASEGDGGGGGAWPEGGWSGEKKKVDGVLTKKFHPLECLSYLLFREGCIWCNCIGNVNKMLLLMGLLAASLPSLASITYSPQLFMFNACSSVTLPLVQRHMWKMFISVYMFLFQYLHAFILFDCHCFCCVTVHIQERTLNANPMYLSDISNDPVLFSAALYSPLNRWHLQIRASSVCSHHIYSVSAVLLPPSLIGAELQCFPWRSGFLLHLSNVKKGLCLKRKTKYI